MSKNKGRLVTDAIVYSSNEDGHLVEQNRTDISNSSNTPLGPMQTGSVINIVNSNKIHVGNSINVQIDSRRDNVDECEYVERTESIDAILVADCEVTTQYRNLVSKHLGRNWRGLFRKLGFDDGYMDTEFESHISQGLREVIYRLLTDWVNAEDRNLGELCTVLWNEQKYNLVKILADFYEKSDKK